MSVFRGHLDRDKNRWSTIKSSVDSRKRHVCCMPTCQQLHSPTHFRPCFYLLEGHVT
jgi:hypothetical protein